MYKAVLMDSDIDESPEGRDIGDYARKFHAGDKVFDFMDIIREAEFLRSLSRIESRLCKFLENVIDGRKAELPFHVFLRLYLGD